MEQKTPRTIAVCLPGRPFEPDWVHNWSFLFLKLAQQFRVVLSFGMGNNIYQVREICLRTLFANPEALRPDYILWIDSDNPPNVDGFDLLLASIEASPMVSAVGAWYRFQNPVTQQSLIAAGRGVDQKDLIQETEIREAPGLIEVAFIGFGMCLMRTEVVEDIGVDFCFAPLYDLTRPGRQKWLTDDAGFFQRARQKGHRVFLHPLVFLEHQKIQNVPEQPGLERSLENGNHSNGGTGRQDLQELDHYRA